MNYIHPTPIPNKHNSQQGANHSWSTFHYTHLLIHFGQRLARRRNRRRQISIRISRVSGTRACISAAIASLAGCRVSVWAGAIELAEEGRDDGRDETLEEVDVLGKRGLDLTWDGIEDIGENKAYEVAGRLVREIDVVRYEVAGAHILAELERVAGVEVHEVDGEIVELVGGVAAEPVVGEGVD